MIIDKILLLNASIYFPKFQKKLINNIIDYDNLVYYLKVKIIH